MERCEQSVCIYLRSNGTLMLLSQSRSSNGLLGGHGKFVKLQIDDSDEVLGAALRACINNRNPGFYQPHRFKEKEKHQAMMAEYIKDRGVVSDKVFFRGTKGVSCDEFSDRIEFVSSDNSATGKGAWLQDPAPITVPLDASDLILAQALRQALAVCIA